jgi:hypothetical protein
MGSPSWEIGPESGSYGEPKVEFSRCSGSEQSYTATAQGCLCSGLEAEMEFGEVKIGVRVYGHTKIPEANFLA